ncbi:MAG: hypothetical protein U0Z75_08005 [Deinococcaceae bacterium]
MEVYPEKKTPRRKRTLHWKRVISLSALAFYGSVAFAESDDVIPITKVPVMHIQEQDTLSIAGGTAVSSEQNP